MCSDPYTWDWAYGNKVLVPAATSPDPYTCKSNWHWLFVHERRRGYWLDIANMISLKRIQRIWMWKKTATAKQRKSEVDLQPEHSISKKRKSFNESLLRAKVWTGSISVVTISFVFRVRHVLISSRYVSNIVYQLSGSPQSNRNKHDVISVLSVV